MSGANRRWTGGGATSGLTAAQVDARVKALAQPKANEYPTIAAANAAIAAGAPGFTLAKITSTGEVVEADTGDTTFTPITSTPTDEVATVTAADVGTAATADLGFDPGPPFRSFYKDGAGNWAEDVGTQPTVVAVTAADVGTKAPTGARLGVDPNVPGYQLYVGTDGNWSTEPVGPRALIDKTPGAYPADLAALTAAVDPTTQPVDEAWFAKFGSPEQVAYINAAGTAWFVPSGSAVSGETFDGVYHEVAANPGDLSGYVFATIDWSGAGASWTGVDGGPSLGQSIFKANAGMFGGQAFDAKATVLAVADSAGLDAGTNWSQTRAQVAGSVDVDFTHLSNDGADLFAHISGVHVSGRGPFVGERICMVIRIEIFKAGTTDPWPINTWQTMADNDRTGVNQEGIGLDTAAAGTGVSATPDLIATPADAFITGFFPNTDGVVWEATDATSAPFDDNNSLSSLYLNASMWDVMVCTTALSTAQAPRNSVSVQSTQNTNLPVTLKAAAPTEAKIYQRFVQPDGTKVYRDETGQIVTPAEANLVPGYPGSSTSDEVFFPVTQADVGSAVPAGFDVGYDPATGDSFYRSPAGLWALDTSASPTVVAATMADVGTPAPIGARFGVDAATGAQFYVDVMGNWQPRIVVASDDWVEVADGATLELNIAHNLADGATVTAPTPATGKWFVVRSRGTGATIAGVTDGAIVGGGEPVYYQASADGSTWDRLPSTPTAQQVPTPTVPADQGKRLEVDATGAYVLVSVTEPNYEPTTTYAAGDVVVSAVPAGSGNGPAGQLARYQRIADGVSAGGASAAMDAGEEVEWTYLGAANDPDFTAATELTPGARGWVPSPPAGDMHVLVNRGWIDALHEQADRDDARTAITRPTPALWSAEDHMKMRQDHGVTRRWNRYENYDQGTVVWMLDGGGQRQAYLATIDVVGDPEGFAGVPKPPLDTAQQEGNGGPWRPIIDTLDSVPTTDNWEPNTAYVAGDIKQSAVAAGTVTAGTPGVLARWERLADGTSNAGGAVGAMPIAEEVHWAYLGPASAGYLAQPDVDTTGLVDGMGFVYDAANNRMVPRHVEQTINAVADVGGRLALVPSIGDEVYQEDKRQLWKYIGPGPASSNANWILTGARTFPSSWDSTDLDWSSTDGDWSQTG